MWGDEEEQSPRSRRLDTRTWLQKEKVVYSKDGEALAQVTQR